MYKLQIAVDKMFMAFAIILHFTFYTLHLSAAPTANEDFVVAEDAKTYTNAVNAAIDYTDAAIAVKADKVWHVEAAADTWVGRSDSSIVFTRIPPYWQCYITHEDGMITPYKIIPGLAPVGGPPPDYLYALVSGSSTVEKTKGRHFNALGGIDYYPVATTQDFPVVYSDYLSNDMARLEADIAGSTTNIAKASLSAAVRSSLDKADAALSRAEAEAGWTEWKIESGLDPTNWAPSATYNGNNTWRVGFDYIGDPGWGLIPVMPIQLVLAGPEASRLACDGGNLGTIYVARTKIRPTKTSELANDGDGTAKYATVTDVAAVASKSEADVAAVASNVATVASVLDERTYVITTNTTTATRTTNDVWLANWDKSIVLRPVVTSGSLVGDWCGGDYTLYCEQYSQAPSGYVWSLRRVPTEDRPTLPVRLYETNTAATLNFGTVGGVRYTLTRYGSYSIRTNTVLKAAKDYTDQQASAALTIVAGMAETIERNAVNAATQYVKAAPVEIPAAAAAKGVTFECAKPNPANPSATCGEEDNGAVAIGRNAKAAVTAAALNAAPSNTVCRSVSVAIGAEADATVSASATKNQAVAIGWHAQAKASNAVAIGGGAQHTFEDAMSGAAAYANASEAVAVGYSAKATANGAVQFGLGTNTTAKSFQFREWQVVNARGQIPAERLVDAADEIAGGMLSQLERLVSPGNMAVMYGGDDDQRIEPRLDGVCDVLMQPDTNGVWMSGAEAYVVPPLGSRNYDLVITNIPQAFRWDHSGDEPTLVPLPEDQNFLFDFSELPQEITPTLRCAASIGYVRGVSMVITNAPLVVRMRQPATNRVVVVVKPWDEWEM